jgi:hypothetical protein
MKKINHKKMEEEQQSLYIDWKILEAMLTVFEKKNPNYKENFNLTIQYIELETKVMIAEHKYNIAVRQSSLEKLKKKFSESEN